MENLAGKKETVNNIKKREPTPLKTGWLACMFVQSVPNEYYSEMCLKPVTVRSLFKERRY